MKNPVLVVMAAGMGSRYGGLKQIDPIGANGEIIMDYSLFDAYKAGFRKVVFVIKEQIFEDFKAIIGNQAEGKFEVCYAFQQLDNIPDGFKVPEGREKPWGTGHAVLAAAKFIDDEPFAVINADDYYGSEAFQKIYDFLVSAEDDQVKHYAMVGYNLMNTLSEHGHVARGVCEVDDNKMLKAIVERTRIEKHGDVAEYTEDNGESWNQLADDTTVSMNLWGFTPSILSELKNNFIKFFDNDVKINPLKSEYFLPFVVNDLLEEKQADAKVLKSGDKWFGVTYKEDKPVVVKAIKDLTNSGKYPEKLWG